NEQLARAIDKVTRQFEGEEILRGTNIASVLEGCTSTTWEEYATVEERIAATGKAAKEFEQGLAIEGIKISKAALAKFGQIIGQHVREASDVDTTESSNLRLIFDALVTRNIFTDAE